MNLIDILRLAADGLGPGAVGVSSLSRTGVISPDMRKRKGMTQVAADASPSDLASHHTWMEPSSTDVTIRQWRSKRTLEKKMKRNLDPFEADAERTIRAGRCRCMSAMGTSEGAEKGWDSRGRGRHDEEETDEEREERDRKKAEEMTDPRKVGASPNKDPQMWRKGDKVVTDAGQAGTVLFQHPLGSMVQWDSGEKELVKSTIGGRRDVTRVK